MSIRKILSMVIVVCLLATQVATVAFAEEIPAETIETIEETAEQEETKIETVEEKEEESEEAEASADIILTAELDDVIVTLKADKDAFENEGELSLLVTPVEIEDTEEEAALDAVEKDNVAKRVTYDITVLDGETPIEPVKEVKVSFELKDAPSGADGVNIYHHDEEEGIEKIATQVLKDDAKEEAAKVGETKTEKDIEVREVSEEELADTDDVAIIDDVTVDGFSLYTVDFTYKDKTISIAGDSTGNKLDDIVSQLGIKEEVTEATAYQDEECTEEAANNEVKSSDGETLYSVYEEGDTWYVDAVNAFQTEHGLVIKTADGAEYKIKVTDAAGNYLTFTANTPGSEITLNALPEWGVKISTDGGENWSDYTKTTIKLTNAGDKVSFKGTNVNTTAMYKFIMTGSIAASGHVTSLTNGTGGDAKLEKDCYASMFTGCTSLTTAPTLPSTTLAEDCYNCMFSGCTNLTTAPALPAETLADLCYCAMFEDCTNLTTAPALPATTLAEGCYTSMFDGCTSMTTAPALPATTLADGCYSEMFSDCTNLATAPALPAEALEYGCYTSMFDGCTNLTTAPALPATTLATGCYCQMFSGCTNLATAPALPATTLADQCYESMFEGCTNLNVYKADQGGQGIILDASEMSGSGAMSAYASDMFKSIGTSGNAEATPVFGNTYYAKVVLPPVTPDPPHVPSSSGGSSSSYTQGWRQSGTSWQYVKSNGAFAKNEWIQIDGKWYHFGNDAMMDTGWLLDTDGSWYYLSKEKGQNEGVMQTGWITDPDDGYRYYLDPITGKMLIGSHVIDGKSYYFTDNVSAPSGWTQNANGDWVYEKRNVIPLGATK